MALGSARTRAIPSAPATAGQRCDHLHPGGAGGLPESPLGPVLPPLADTAPAAAWPPANSGRETGTWSRADTADVCTAASSPTTSTAVDSRASSSSHTRSSPAIRSDSPRSRSTSPQQAVSHSRSSASTSSQPRGPPLHASQSTSYRNGRPPQQTRRPQHRHSRRPAPCGGRPPGLDEERYKKCNTVERAINRLKQHRPLATRYDKRGYVFLGTAPAAAFTIWLRT
jgi:transposase